MYVTSFSTETVNSRGKTLFESGLRNQLIARNLSAHRKAECWPSNVTFEGWRKSLRHDLLRGVPTDESRFMSCSYL